TESNAFFFPSRLRRVHQAIRSHNLGRDSTLASKVPESASLSQSGWPTGYADFHLSNQSSLPSRLCIHTFTGPDSWFSEKMMYSRTDAPRTQKVRKVRNISRSGFENISIWRIYSCEDASTRAMKTSQKPPR